MAVNQGAQLLQAMQIALFRAEFLAVLKPILGR
jgi:hypothetical protein